jgi:hypothetical protein
MCSSNHGGRGARQKRGTGAVGRTFHGDAQAARKTSEGKQKGRRVGMRARSSKSGDETRNETKRAGPCSGGWNGQVKQEPRHADASTPRPCNGRPVERWRAASPRTRCAGTPDCSAHGQASRLPCVGRSPGGALRTAPASLRRWPQARVDTPPSRLYR